MNIIKTVHLRNFRSHADFKLSCEKPTTLIIGENGSGKTSVLEAIYLALVGKSFKGMDDEMVRRGEEAYRVEVEHNDGKRVIVRCGGTREFEVGGKKTRRLPKKNKYPVTLFEPDDLYLVGASPTRRRDYFDKILAQINEEYRVALSKYNKALKQRNDYLKKEVATRDGVFVWDVLLAKYGTLLNERRVDFADRLNRSLTETYRSIADNQDVCRVEIDRMQGGESEYLAELTRRYGRDCAVGHTTYGAHRDDWRFWFNEQEANGSASRGEVRSMVLALKFIEARVIREETGRNPVVLLDDIFSELDEVRQKQLVDNFKGYQVIISGTKVPEGLGDNVRL